MKYRVKLSWFFVVFAGMAFLMGTMACTKDFDYTLKLGFEDSQAENSVDEITLWAIDATDNNCQELIEGTVDILQLTIFSKVIFKYGQSQKLVLSSVPKGEIIFFAEGRDELGRKVLRGCQRVKVESEKSVNVSLTLVWKCHSGNCDDTSPCTEDACQDGLCQYVNLDNIPCGDVTTDTECDKPNSCLSGICQPNYSAIDTLCGEQGVYCHVDDTCDGSGNCVDNGFVAAYDLDRDGYIDQACGGTDCDDNNPNSNPDAPEICDGKDNNCNDTIPPGELGSKDCRGNVIYVNVGSDASSPDGSSWDSAFTDVQAGIYTVAASPTGAGQVWVAAGTYEIFQSSSEDTVLLLPDVLVYGGFLGTEEFLYDRDYINNKTILDGSNSVEHVVLAGEDSLIDGFTIKGGKTDPEDPEGAYGAGLVIADVTNVTVENCTFVENHSDSVQYDAVAGAIYIMSDGANEQLDARIVNCSFFDNTAKTIAGAILVEGAKVDIINCVFSNNDSSYSGTIALSNPKLVNIFNSTFYRNNCSLPGCCSSIGLTCDNDHPDCKVTIMNSIFWNDVPDSIHISVDPITPDGALTVSHSLIENGYAPGDKIINSDPYFVDVVSDDFRLQSTSPCIDAGSAQDTINGGEAPFTDKDGYTRFDDPYVDPNSGTGDPNYIDLGAYEYFPN